MSKKFIKKVILPLVAAFSMAAGPLSTRVAADDTDYSIQQEGKIIDVRSEAHLNDILELGQPVLIAYTAEWCGFCRQTEPMLKRLARQRAGQLSVLRVDVEKVPELAEGIRTLPTLRLAQKNLDNSIDRLGKPKTEIALQQWINSHLTVRPASSPSP